MTSIKLDPNDWTISPPQPGIKGGKTCLISHKNKPIEINLGLGAPLSTPFGASNFEEDEKVTRVNLDLTVPSETADLFKDLDEWLIQYGIQNKEILFKSKTDQQIRDNYRTLIRQKDSHPPLLRTKVDLAKVRVWDAQHAPTIVPETKFKYGDIFPKIVVRTLWVVNQTWGLTLECTDLKFIPNQIDCPF